MYYDNIDGYNYDYSDDYFRVLFNLPTFLKLFRVMVPKSKLTFIHDHCLPVHVLCGWWFNLCVTVCHF